jgi:hypothetical protein
MEDDYGRRRSAEFDYALTGGKVGVQAKMPTAMESALRGAGMHETEISEAARVIPMGLQKMGANAPEVEQQKFVAMMMGSCVNGKPDVLASVTKLAGDIAHPKSDGITMQAKPMGSSYGSYKPPTQKF